MGLLDGDLAQAIYDGFKGRLLSGIIRQRTTSGGLDSYGDPVGQSSSDSTIEGFVEEYDDSYIANAGIPKDSIKVNIFAKSADGVRPSRDDIVRFDRGATSTWYQLRRVKTDPAEALWVCPDAFEIEAPL